MQRSHGGREIKKALRFLKPVSVILFLSLGIFVFRFITSIPLLLILGDWLVNEKTGWFIGVKNPIVSSILLMVIGQFGQVIASFGAGVFCGMRCLYGKPKLCGIGIIACASFLFALLIFLSDTSLLEKGRTLFILLDEGILFMLSILAVIAGSKVGER